MPKKYPYLDLFWFPFSRIWTEYSVWIPEIVDQNNFKYRHVSRSGIIRNKNLYSWDTGITKILEELPLIFPNFPDNFSVFWLKLSIFSGKQVISTAPTHPPQQWNNVLKFDFKTDFFENPETIRSTSPNRNKNKNISFFFLFSFQMLKLINSFLKYGYLTF